MSLYLRKLGEYYKGLSKLETSNDHFVFWKDIPIIEDASVINWVDRGFFKNDRINYVEFGFATQEFSWGPSLRIPLLENEVQSEWISGDLGDNHFFALYGSSKDRSILDMQSVERLLDCKIIFFCDCEILKPDLDSLKGIIYAANLDIDYFEFHISDSKKLEHKTIYQNVRITFPVRFSEFLSQLYDFMYNSL